jgi:hypothetical protein
MGTHTRAAFGWKEIEGRLVDRVEGGLFKKAVKDEDFASMKLVLSAKARDRGYGPDGAAGAGGDAGPGIGVLKLMSVPSSYFVLNKRPNTLLNAPQREAEAAGASDAEIAELGPDENELPVGMLPPEVEKT